MRHSSDEYPFSELDTLHHINFYSRDNWTLVRREPERGVVQGTEQSFRIKHWKTWKGEVEQKPAGIRGEKDIGVEVLDGLLAIGEKSGRGCETLNGSFSRSPRGRWIL